MQLTEEQKGDFNNLLDYIRFNLLGYDEKMKIPNLLFSRIYGTAFGKTFYHHNKKDTEFPPFIYQFKIIYITVIYCKNEINNCLSTMTFKNEGHRINTIFKIVDDNINFVKQKMEKKEEENKRIEAKDNSDLGREVQSYRKKSEIKDKFKEYL